MIVASHQPNYLPNLGFLYKMAQSDTFVIFTNLQFSTRDGWVRRHKIKGPNKDLWLTVPVHCSTSADQLIKDVMIDNSHNWWHSHKATIRQSYAKTPHKAELDHILEAYDQKWKRLCDLNIDLITRIKDVMQITTRIVVDEDVSGEKQELLINMAKKHGADTYLSGMGGKIYMTDEYYDDLAKNGIKMAFVEKDLTALYPYTSLHYMFTDGIGFVQNLFDMKTGLREHLGSPAVNA